MARKTKKQAEQEAKQETKKQPVIEKIESELVRYELTDDELQAIGRDLAERFKKVQRLISSISMISVDIIDLDDFMYLPVMDREIGEHERQRALFEEQQSGDHDADGEADPADDGSESNGNEEVETG